MAAPIPTNEKERLSALYKLRVLDSPAEQAFDQLTKLAAQICGCPTSVISLIDRDRQWFKSTFNFDAKETPRDFSFCAYTILQQGILEVPNTQTDDRFKEHPAVTGDPKFRFYAAAPVTIDNEMNIGAICVLDTKEHILTPFQRESLLSLSRLASHLLEGRKASLYNLDLVSAQTKIEMKMTRAAQITVLAEMTAGLAHEINNPLAIIKLSSEGLQQFFPQEKVLASHFGRLNLAVDRIQKITRGLITFARDARHDEPSRAQLKDLIADTLPFCKDQLHEHRIHLSIESYSQDFSLQCRPVEISQIILNLINNAVDAVKVLPERWIKLAVTDTGANLQIVVTDSGLQISPELQEQIFQPFFTTKKVNHGTGLGLSICRAIAERHGGSIVIDPKSRQTSFILTLPKAQPLAA